MTTLVITINEHGKEEIIKEYKGHIVYPHNTIIEHDIKDLRVIMYRLSGDVFYNICV